jgi:hypothetical protein
LAVGKWQPSRLIRPEWRAPITSFLLPAVGQI